MSLAGHKKHGSYSANFIIRVKADQGLSLSGSIEDINEGRIQDFSDFLELILMMHRQMDAKGKPMSDSLLRDFND